MAYSSEEERYTILVKVAEVISACGDKPITREALVLTLAQKIFPEPKYDYERKRREKFINKCLVNE